MAHQLRRDARRRRARGTVGRVAVGTGFVALVLLALFGARIDLLDLRRATPVDASSAAVDALRWALGTPARGAPHVLVPEVRSGAEQLGRPTSGPEPWSTTGVLGALVAALGWMLLTTGRRSVRPRTAAGPIRRRGPPAPRAIRS